MSNWAARRFSLCALVLGRGLLESPDKSYFLKYIQGVKAHPNDKRAPRKSVKSKIAASERPVAPTCTVSDINDRASIKPTLLSEERHGNLGCDSLESYESGVKQLSRTTDLEVNSELNDVLRLEIDKPNIDHSTAEAQAYDDGQCHQVIPTNQLSEDAIERRATETGIVSRTIDKCQEEYISKTDLLQGLSLVIDSNRITFEPINDVEMDKNIRSYIANHLVPFKAPVAFHVAYYVNENAMMRKLVDLNVRVHNWPFAAVRSVIMLEPSVALDPLVDLLSTLVSEACLSAIITSNPKLLLPKYSTNHVKNHVQCLSNLGFSSRETSLIFERSSLWLGNAEADIRTRMRSLAECFFLNEDELRTACISFPALVDQDITRVLNVQFRLKNILGFTGAQIRLLFLTHPSLFRLAEDRIDLNFDYLYNEYHFTHSNLAKNPYLLTSRPFLLFPRLDFLEQSLGKVDYWILEPVLADKNDLTFCKHFKLDFNKYIAFLKTR